MSKTMLEFIRNTWKSESTGVFAQFLFNFEDYFLYFPWEIVFGVNSRKYIFLYLL